MPQCSLKTTVCTGSATRVSKQRLETADVCEDVYCCDACGEYVFRDVASFHRQYMPVDAAAPDIWVGLLDGVVQATYASIRDAADAAVTHTRTMVLRYVPASRIDRDGKAKPDAIVPNDLSKEEAQEDPDDARRYVNEWREAARQASTAIVASCPDLEAEDPDAFTDSLNREGTVAAAPAATRPGDATKRTLVAPWDKNELATHRRVVDRYPAITSLIPMPGDHVARWVATLDEAQARIDELTQSRAKAVDAIADVCTVLHCDHHYMVDAATRLRDECAVDKKQLSESRQEVSELEEIISDAAAAAGIMLGGDGDGGLVDAVDALHAQLTVANAKLKEHEGSPHRPWVEGVQTGYARGIHDAAQRISTPSAWLPVGGQNERLRVGLADHVRVLADVCVIMNDDVQHTDARTDARKSAATTHNRACDSCGDDDPLTERVRVGEQWLCHDCAPDEPVAPDKPRESAERIHTYWHGMPCQCLWAADHGNGGPDGPDFAKGRDHLDDEQRPDILVLFSSFGPEKCRTLADATDMDRQEGVLYIPAYRLISAAVPGVRTQKALP